MRFTTGTSFVGLTDCNLLAGNLGFDGLFGWKWSRRTIKVSAARTP